ncbi:MAG: ABC transporter permease [Vicinamibacterales bacterium]
MRHWHRLRELCRTLFRGRRVDRDLDDELHDWVETLAARHRARGANAGEADRLARVELGGLAQVKEEARAVRNGSQLESTSMDVRYAWRAWRRTPGVALTAVLTFALGIGAATAIFSVVRAVLIEPLPYPNAGRLLLVWADLTDIGYPHAPLAGPELVEFQDGVKAFDAVGGVWATNATLVAGDDPEQLRLATVTPDFFAVLGAQPVLGRVLGPDDFGQTVTPVLLSHALWLSSFGGDPGVVGRAVTLNDRPARVIGVMGAEFRLLFPPDAAVPEDLQAWVPGGARLAAQPRGQQYLRVIGRLAPGARADEGVAQVEATGASIIAANPGSYTPGSRFYAVPMQEDAVRPIRGALLALFGGVLILLVIACVNIAGLLVVRAVSRRPEIALRRALGASAGRLFRQCLVEGLLLSCAGGLLGLAAARGALLVLTSLAPSGLPRVRTADLDPGVLGFCAAAVLVWGLAFSLMPWLDAWRRRLSPPLARDSRTTPGAPGGRFRAALIVSQLALGLVLLVGAVLLARTFARLVHLDPGFRAEGVLTFRVAPPFSRYPPGDGQKAFHRLLTDRLLALPGVVDVGSVSHVPYDNLPNWGTPYLPTGETDGAKSGLADTRTVSPGFFRTIGATMTAGRDFDEHDAFGEDLPVVIDELMAARLFGSGDPVGRTFQSDLGGTGRMAPLRVVGVVGHLRHRSLTEAGREQLYVPSRLVPRNPVAYAVRTTGAPADLVPQVRALVKTLDPRLPVYDARPLEDYLVTARAAHRFTLTLGVAFAGIALLLASVGMYGVMAYAVGRRRREFGVRLALGARPGQILWMVLREGGRLLAAGALLGSVGALLTARLIRSQLFEVAPWDPISYLVGAAVLLTAALAASLEPALRASRSGSLASLRED